MIEAVGSFLGRFAIYISVLLGVMALYFVWVALREWRSSSKAVFGVERDIATSEMIGALSRAGILIVIGAVIFGLGQIETQSEPEEEAVPRATLRPVQTSSVLATATLASSSEPQPTLIPSNTPQPEVTGVPPLPEVTMTPLPLEPTPQTALVAVFGGLWLRDAPNGGTVVVLPEDTVVELLEGRESAGNLEWQKVRVLNTPLGSDAQAGQEGWVASQYLEVGP